MCDLVTILGFPVDLPGMIGLVWAGPSRLFRATRMTKCMGE